MNLHLYITYTSKDNPFLTSSFLYTLHVLLSFLIPFPHLFFIISSFRPPGLTAHDYGSRRCQWQRQCLLQGMLWISAGQAIGQKTEGNTSTLASFPFLPVACLSVQPLSTLPPYAISVLSHRNLGSFVEFIVVTPNISQPASCRFPRCAWRCCERPPYHSEQKRCPSRKSSHL